MTLRSRRLPAGFWKGASGRKTTGRSKSTRAVKSLAPRARKAVATIAKRVMNRAVETKYIAENQDGIAIYGDTLPGGGIAQVYTCVPDITQGDTSFDRQGLKLNPKRHTTQLQFTFNEDPQILSGGVGVPAAQAGWDVTVHVWYGFAKRYKNVVDIQANAAAILAEMLDTGNGGQSRFTGLMSDELFEVNKEFLTLRHKKVRLFKNAGRANILDVTAPALTTPNIERASMSLSWKAPKTLLYKDEVAVIPENYAPFIIVGYVHNDGTQASDQANTGPTNNPLQVSAIKMVRTDKVWFKDA